jgi:hypothetical protein
VCTGGGGSTGAEEKDSPIGYLSGE